MERIIPIDAYLSMHHLQPAKSALLWNIIYENWTDDIVNTALIRASQIVASLQSGYKLPEWRYQIILTLSFAKCDFKRGVDTHGQARGTS
jgi:hypothetical protein